MSLRKVAGDVITQGIEAGASEITRGICFVLSNMRDFACDRGWMTIEGLASFYCLSPDLNAYERLGLLSLNGDDGSQTPRWQVALRHEMVLRAERLGIPSPELKMALGAMCRRVSGHASPMASADLFVAARQ